MADWRLQVFHAVATHLSFTNAAQALLMSQPAVTFQIKQLERQYGTRLFERAQRRTALTPAGVVALEYAQRILGLSAELDGRLKEVSERVGGSLSIGASTTLAGYLLPQMLGEFKQYFPAVMPRLLVANSEAVQDRVAARSLDVGFIEGDSHLSSLVAEVCCEDELRVVCSPAHPLAGQRRVTAASLAGHAYVSREPDSGTRGVIENYMQKARVPPKSLATVMELGSPESLKGLLATGLGFTIMSRACIVKEKRLGQLVDVPLAPPLHRRLSIVYLRGERHSRLIVMFGQFAKGALRRLTIA